MAPADRTTETPESSFTVGDVLGTAFAVVFVIGLFAFPVIAKSFLAMYAEFEVELPGLTKLVLTSWFPPTLALLPAFLVANGMRTSLGMPKRRLSIFAAFLLSSAMFAACLWGIYAPVFRIADAIE